MWYWQNEESPQAWPQTPWALDLDLQDFPRNVSSKSLIDGKPFMKGEWFWESGFKKDSINDLEYIRDWNLRAVFGAFSALKHGAEKEKHTNAALKWVASVGGTRESRMLDGDVILQREDIVQGRDFNDGAYQPLGISIFTIPRSNTPRSLPTTRLSLAPSFGLEWIARTVPCALSLFLLQGYSESLHGGAMHQREP